MGPRNMYISLLVFVGILVPGAVIFRHDDIGYQGAGIAAFVCCFAVLHMLDARQRRQEGRE